MQVIKAKCAGACYGVQRALDMAKEAADHDGGATTIGPLIHNPQVVSSLLDAGVCVADTLDQVTKGPIIIRSHGVTPEVLHAAESSAYDVIDATCPHVLRAQAAAAQLAQNGFTVLVVGEEKHPEVEGLTAWARSKGSRVIVVQAAEVIPNNLQSPVGIVVQTTQPASVLDDVVVALKKKGIEPEVRNTICSATTQRQQAAADLAAQVDVMVVIGGHNSSNTTRLFEICESSAPRAYHIEVPAELDTVDFSEVKTVGVTAGASTPESQIQDVVEYLECL